MCRLRSVAEALSSLQTLCPSRYIPVTGANHMLNLSERYVRLSANDVICAHLWLLCTVNHIVWHTRPCDRLASFARREWRLLYVFYTFGDSPSHGTPVLPTERMPKAVVIFLHRAMIVSSPQTWSEKAEAMFEHKVIAKQCCKKRRCNAPLILRSSARLITHVFKTYAALIQRYTAMSWAVGVPLPRLRT
jgi:hypothetical protein